MSEGNIAEAVKNGTYRDQLVAVRDYLVHELEGHRCDRCAMSQLKTGDTASLVLRLQKVLEEIEGIPAEGQVESPTDEILERRKRRGADQPRRSAGRR